MRYEINLVPRAEKELDELARKQPGDAAAIEDAIEDAIENFAEYPRLARRDRLPSSLSDSWSGTHGAPCPGA
ncbi:ParE-like toxin of type II ParDE toxin-antitoxin system [Halopolyspora algeriensis]|uniref:ParE-like toxin of type II ParDE toxin-antitoxin system n=1 Tax=Halopolyspora algeriensis TaxID=1500506 RepID=A0A368VWX7_9ACTN|nr:type II toxin-antitoxin system RelE/ParE family toxin [Halopolyspora algeriensis]RCW45860.1 ParE-like toxin of type II ParDE toxin-antitoxin system [Halopolyspora algeriensis]TQM55275.1 ParE-like toxin of type II ParDE toxin-antitoxin system [Halopolyspora algeriensis]